MQQIIVLGDSHVIIYKETGLTSLFKCSIHHTDNEHCDRYGKFLPFLMNTIADSAFDLLDVYLEKVKQGDLLLFIFGEPDCRIHINRQITHYNREEDEVINTLALKYVSMLERIQKEKGCKVIIRYVLPPVDTADWPLEIYKAWGTIEERVRYTNKLNLALKEYTKKADLLFFDNTMKQELICSNGSLSPEFIVDTTHYNTKAVKYLDMEIDYFVNNVLGEREIATHQ